MDLKDNQTFEEARQWASFFLKENHQTEVPALTYLLRLLDMSLTDYVKNKYELISDEQRIYLNDAFHRIINHEPLEYIVGYRDFMERRFKVTKDTLIPREETSGIIELVLQLMDVNQSLNVIDIGTGTGILAITLKKMFPHFQVTASDISLEALEIAKFNASYHDVQIKFHVSDVLKDVKPSNKFDVIVSNPPYISDSEVEYMDQSVYLYEPKKALFADENGLAIIERIMNESQKYLNTSGILIIEFGFKQADYVEKMARKYYPNASINVHQDINQIKRFISIMNKESIHEN